MSKYYTQGEEAPAHAQQPHAKAEKGPRYKAEYDDVAVCKECNAIYFKKAWHASAADIAEEYNDKPTSFTVCPADEMKQKGLFEGEVRVSGASDLQREEIRNLIENYDEEARRRNTLHRVLEIKEEQGDIIATTSEDQMAAKIARKIEDAFHAASTHVAHSEEPYKVTRAHVRLN